jgi:hypothetical protein
LHRKARARSLHLVHALIRRDHLCEGFEAARAPPRLLDGLDVLRLRDGGTEAVRSTKEADGVRVMHDAVLAREGDVVPNAGLDEDLTVLMKSLKRDLQVRKTLRVDSVAPGNVTEFQKRRKSLNNVGWNDP